MTCKKDQRPDPNTGCCDYIVAFQPAEPNAFFVRSFLWNSCSWRQIRDGNDVTKIQISQCLKTLQQDTKVKGDCDFSERTALSSDALYI